MIIGPFHGFVECVCNSWCILEFADSFHTTSNAQCRISKSPAFDYYNFAALE